MSDQVATNAQVGVMGPPNKEESILFRSSCSSWTTVGVSAIILWNTFPRLLEGAGFVRKADRVAEGDVSCSFRRNIVPSRVTYINLKEVKETTYIWMRKYSGRLVRAFFNGFAQIPTHPCRGIGSSIHVEGALQWNGRCQLTLHNCISSWRPIRQEVIFRKSTTPRKQRKNKECSCQPIHGANARTAWIELCFCTDSDNCFRVCCGFFQQLKGERLPTNSVDNRNCQNEAIGMGAPGCLPRYARRIGASGRPIAEPDAASVQGSAQPDLAHALSGRSA